MTLFIDSPATEQLLPPWKSARARIWCFFVTAPTDRTQDYLDTHLNSSGPDHAPYRYVALDKNPYGILMVARHDDFSSGAVGSTGWDRLGHCEVHWSVPVFRYRVTPDNLLVERTKVWVQPFAFDDNSYVMFSAREIWGTEMEMARIDIVEGKKPGDTRIDVAIDGFKVFAPRSKSALIGAIHVRLAEDTKALDVGKVFLLDPALVALLFEIYGDLNYQGKPIFRLDPQTRQGMVPPGEVAPAQSDRLWTGVVELNTLKQFRDVFDMQVAAYRAIVASGTSYSNVSDLTFYQGKNVAMNFMWSDSLAEKFEKLFGLVAPPDLLGQQGHSGDSAPLDRNRIDWNLPRVPVEVALAVSFTADADFKVLGTLHTYGLPGTFQALAPATRSTSALKS